MEFLDCRSDKANRTDASDFLVLCSTASSSETRDRKRSFTNSSSETRVLRAWILQPFGSVVEAMEDAGDGVEYVGDRAAA